LGDGQNFGFRCSLEGKNISVLALECCKFVLGYGLIAGKNAAGHE
jgi:hypothetical protein